MQDTDRIKLNKAQIESHLKSAVDTLTPNVLDKIDLSTPQEAAAPRTEPSRVVSINRRLRGLALTAAACLCLVVMGGGAYTNHQNQRIEAVIGIDVNPSVELNINRKNKVLQANALNQEGEAVLAGMELNGVDLNVAVHAIIGSMVTNGYLDELDNAILVTVSNDSISKASALRAEIVSDIEKTLEENQVQAVVYDQQVIELDEIKALAGQYEISYGKAYFLKELISQNPSLTMADMAELSSLSMEEIARKITEQSYALGEFAEKKEDPTTAAATSREETSLAETTDAEETAAPETLPAETTPAVKATEPESATVVPTTEAGTEAVKKDRVKIDYADYEDGCVYVYFVTKVKWQSPTVSVFDEDGESYAAKVTDTSGKDCVIEVAGLEGGKSYTFVLGGLTPVEGGGATTVTGYFDKPVIAGEVLEEEDEDDDESAESTEAVTSAADSEAVPESAGGAETEPAGETNAKAESNSDRENGAKVESGARGTGEDNQN